MRRLRRLSVLGVGLAVFLVGTSGVAAAEAAVSSPAVPRGSRGPGLQRSELSPEQKQWLDIVAYIIQDDEKKIFEGLATEWQREQFIQAFWKRRDPEPATPENEFYIEHMRRWTYANDVLGRDTPMPGWRTDRGRVYIVNGPPFKVFPYPDTQELWPLEVWEYRDTPKPGMPGFYQIIFFKPRVFNEWRLYSPAVDGPQALVISSPADIELMDFQRLATKFPIVFAAAARVAPGYGRLDSEVVIARTMAPPPPPRPLALVRSGEVESAFVGTRSLHVGLSARGFVHPGLGGYVDLALEIPTSDATFVEVGEQFVANYKVEFEITTPDAGTWHEPGGQVVVRVPREEFEQTRDLPILYRRRLWLLPGQYEIRALLTEAATHRVGVAEQVATVPAPSDLTIGPPVLFYVTEADETGSDNIIPWVGSRLPQGHPVSCRVHVATGAEFEAGAAGAWPASLEIEYRLVQGKETVWRDTWTGDPAPRADSDGWGIARTLNIEALPPGTYVLEVSAGRRSGDGGSSPNLRSVGTLPIEIVDGFLPFARILAAHPKAFDMAAAHHEIGEQFLRRNNFSAARQHFQQAVRLDSQNVAYQVDAAKMSVLAGDLGVAEFFLQRAVRSEPHNAEAWATYGLLRVRKGDFPAAIEAYSRSLDLAPGTPAVYNGFAEALLSTGQRQRALEMLEHSLEINPQQQQVRQLRDQLRSGEGRDRSASVTEAGEAAFADAAGVRTGGDP